MVKNQAHMVEILLLIMLVIFRNYLGCTANVVVIDSEFYYCANSGDSRSVLSRAGKIVSLS